MIVNVLERRPLPIHGDGRNVRDRLFLADHYRGKGRVVDRGRAREIYNVGGRAKPENVALVDMLYTLADELFAAERALRSRFPHCPSASRQSARSIMTVLPDRPGHYRRHASDNSKIERVLGFERTVMPELGPRTSLD